MFYMGIKINFCKSFLGIFNLKLLFAALLFGVFPFTVFSITSKDSKPLSPLKQIYYYREVAKQNFKTSSQNALLPALKSYQLATTSSTKIEIAKSALLLAKIHLRMNEINQAKQFLAVAYRNINKQNEQAELANYNFLLSDLQLRTAQYDSSDSSLNKALKFYQKTQSFEEIILVYNKLGQLYYIQENYKNAMIFYLKALQQAEQLNNNSEIANCYINISNVLSVQVNYTAAIKYLQKAATIFVLQKDSFNLAVCYNNLAANYIQQDSLTDALKYLTNAAEMHVSLKNQKGLAASYLNMGIVQSKTEQYNLAIQNFEKALNINLQLNDKFRISTCLSNLSITYLKINDYSKSASISEQGLKLSKEINAFDAQRIFYTNLSIAYDSLKQYKKSLYYYQLQKQLDDSLLNTELRKQVLELEAKYQNEKKEDDIQILTKDNLLKNSQLERNRSLQLYLTVIVVLVFLLLLVLYGFFQNRVKTAKILTTKNSELEKLNLELQKTGVELKELNATKDKFFTIIAHDIQNPLSAYRAITKTLSTQFFEINEEQKLVYINKLYKSSENLNLLFKNLLQWSTSQTGKIAFNPQEIDLEILSFKAISVLEESAENKNILLKLEILPTTFAFGDVHMVTTILLNLISNAIKFSGTDCSIIIKSELEEKYLKIVIEDHGIGIQAEEIMLLFDSGYDTKNIGDSKEKGSGIGLVLCKEFAERNGGQIGVTSELGKGSKFYFTLPLYSSKIENKTDPNL